MVITLRQFEEKDIPAKVRWVNDPRNNTYLHYDLPLQEDKTLRWFKSHNGENTRYDAVIEADSVPVGLIGLLGIDRKNKKAEYYILLGETEYKGKGIAKRASELLLDYAFSSLQLNKVYLYTEVENIAAQKLFERVGFIEEGRAREDLYSKERFVDRVMYGILRSGYKVGGGTG
ncbi:MAG: GNAT family protein [Oscillospiraceae bacterium]|nr:GNAT family protein [Oscillospiraceae bacterium]